MARFAQQVEAVRALIRQGMQRGRIRALPVEGAGEWPTGRTFVLARDAALDLGSPAAGSVGWA